MIQTRKDKKYMVHFGKNGMCIFSQKISKINMLPATGGISQYYCT